MAEVTDSRTVYIYTVLVSVLASMHFDGLVFNWLQFEQTSKNLNYKSGAGIMFVLKRLEGIRLVQLLMNFRFF